jgi:hypothetical protein
MKRTGLYATGILCILFSLNAVAQTGVEKKILATMGPGETLAYGENCFLLSQSTESISFVTVVGSGSDKQYYCYGKDGQKIGPVKSPDSKYWSEGANKKAEDCVPNDEPNMANMEKYVAHCDLWMSTNGTDYAWANYDNLSFKDGTKYPAPLEVSYSTTGGKGYLKWISLEDGKNLVFYKKPF